MTGIYWLDIKADNVVRLLRPNKLNLKLDGEEIRRNEDSVEMTGLKDEEPLEAGELVIADTDFIYSKEDSSYIHNLLVPNYDLFLEFTKRYNKEKKYIPSILEFEVDEHDL